MVKHYDPRSTGQLFDESDRLGVVFLLDGGVVLESLVRGGPVEVLETVPVKGGLLCLGGSLFEPYVLPSPNSCEEQMGLE